MNRRTVLAGLSAGLTGCLGRGADRPQPGEADGTEPETATHSNVTPSTVSPPSNGETNGLTAKLVVVDGQMPAPDESVSVTTNCETKTAELIGWFRPPTGCHEMVLRSLEYNQTEDRATIVLSSKWGNSRSPNEVDCGGATFKYNITLTSATAILEAIQIVYQSPDGEQTNAFDLQTETC